MLVFGILASVVLGLVLSAQRTSVDNRNRVAAANLAAREVEYVREQFMATASGPMDVANAGTVNNPHPLAGGVAGDPLVLDGTAYSVVRSVMWNITGETGVSACEGGTLVEHPSLIVTVRVTWPGMGITEPVVNQAVLAPDRGAGLPTTASFAAVAVKDSAGAPNPYRTVVVSSSSETRTGLTDTSGCAVIPLAPPVAGAELHRDVPGPRLRRHHRHDLADPFDRSDQPGSAGPQRRGLAGPRRLGDDPRDRWRDGRRGGRRDGEPLPVRGVRECDHPDHPDGREHRGHGPVADRLHRLLRQ